MMQTIPPLLITPSMQMLTADKQLIALHTKKNYCTYVSRTITICFVFIIMVLNASIISCSGADPVIYQLETQLQAYWNYPYEFSERLLVQILADDDDGFDEIYEVYIIHDEKELYWRATKDDWDLLTDRDGKDWIVLTNIISSKNDAVPRGEYRVVLMDYSGYRDERLFEIDAPIDTYTRKDFPVLSIQSGKTYVPVLNISSPEPKTLYMELSYPDAEEDIAGNIKLDELRKEISFLGKEGTFYEVQRGVPIKFVLNEKSRINVILHRITDTGILFTAGPFTVNFDKIQ